MKSINPNQFRLFMTGMEWQAEVTHSTDGPMPELWDEKSDQAKATGLYDNIRDKGYQHNTADPPTIVLENSPNGKSVRHVQSQGHKRIAAAASLERETGKPVYIPTNYVDNTRRNR